MNEIVVFELSLVAMRNLFQLSLLAHHLPWSDVAQSKEEGNVQLIYSVEALLPMDRSKNW